MSNHIPTDAEVFAGSYLEPIKDEAAAILARHGGDAEAAARALKAESLANGEPVEDLDVEALAAELIFAAQ